MVLKFFILLMGASFYLYGATPSGEVEIPRTAYKDIYKYYLLEKSKKSSHLEVTYKRSSVDSILYGKIEINCTIHQVHETGQSLLSVKKIPYTPTNKWYTPRISSFQADIMNFVCR